jgi:hypothetical protein
MKPGITSDGSRGASKEGSKIPLAALHCFPVAAVSKVTLDLLKKPSKSP